MNFKNLCIGTCACAISFIVSANTFAYANQEYYDYNEYKVEAKKDKSEGNKGKIKLDYEEMKTKWDKLNNEQKEEIFMLKDRAFEIECQILDKYVEFDIIDKNTATKMRDGILQYKNEMRENNKMPIKKWLNK